MSEIKNLSSDFRHCLKFKLNCLKSELVWISDIHCTQNILLQIFRILLFAFLLNIANSVQTPDETTLELALCELLNQTPFYAVFQLQMQNNCISQVKMFSNDVFCLRNLDNKVKNSNTKLN